LSLLLSFSSDRSKPRKDIVNAMSHAILDYHFIDHFDITLVFNITLPSVSYL